VNSLQWQAFVGYLTNVTRRDTPGGMLVNRGGPMPLNTDSPETSARPERLEAGMATT
jgi:hypothetical protein